MRSSWSLSRAQSCQWWQDLIWGGEFNFSNKFPEKWQQTIHVKRWIALMTGINLTSLLTPGAYKIDITYRSFLTSVTLKWNGEAQWITFSNGGSDFTALSKAPSTAMSSTIAMSSFSLGTLGCASLMVWALASDRTVVTTEWPCSSRISRTWAAMKPLPPRFSRLDVNHM